MKLADIRREYALEALDRHHVDSDPLKQFQYWFKEAEEAHVHDSTAMTLATADANGVPSCRIVLLKGIEEQKFVFYTNYQSKKGVELITNPVACLNFYWSELERQVRVDGNVEKVSEEQSESYFRSRPRESQISTWVSQQSQQVASREALEAKFAEIEKEYQNKEIPRPPHWGGFAVDPLRLEFWQGRTGRLHDRIVFEKQTNGTWEIYRIAP
ncbi:pyridoxamine 5'-phosphate oxidase [Rapidithrix thailandica]|uniref:Pyridoxine/pyridoxamine 5'-phosphate oxidase n=1 Tax=Rapidithrix thailandica TaxID=413964 RepID=A0AAW9S4L4_9BACT